MNRLENHTENAAPTGNCDILLREACKTYREVERLYAVVLGSISDVSPTSVDKATASLTGLLRDAYNIDSAIAKKLGPAAELAESTQALLQQREDILRRLHRSNRTLVNKAENIQSLIRHEINGMAKNRSALKGYKPVEAERKSIIRSSF